VAATNVAAVVFLRIDLYHSNHVFDAVQGNCHQNAVVLVPAVALVLLQAGCTS
jgi:hypothetical protein